MTATLDAIDLTEVRACPACGRSCAGALSLGSHVGQAHPEDSLRLRMEAFTEVRGPGECWRWRGRTQTNGYAQLYVDGRPLLVTRVLLGIIDRPGVMVLHSCDVKGCVNPAHLRIGTVRDNARDAQLRGRLATKLTETDVHAIRAGRRLGLTLRELGRRHGVSSGAVHAVLAGKLWTHVPDLAWLADERPAPAWQPCPPDRLAELYRTAARQLAGRRAVDTAASPQVTAGARDDQSREAEAAA